MKAGGLSDGNSSAAILIVALLGCLAISAQCARAPSLAGERGEIEAAAAPAQAPAPAPGYQLAQPFCYKMCAAGCSYCCASDDTPTVCWPTEAKCKEQCHPHAVYPPVDDNNCNQKGITVEQGII